MGKYSLENHERYQTTKIRPANLPVLNELEWDGEVLSLDGMEDILDRLANGKPFALSIRLDGRHPAELGRRMALLGLQRHWRKGPVLVDPGVVQGESECGLLQVPVQADEVARHNGENRIEEIRREAIRWHASTCGNLPGFGSRVELRKMAYPSAVTSGGAWPVRLWWVSSGTAPCYGSHRIDLRLASEALSADLALGADINRFIEGDHTCNVVLRLPELPAGTYTVGIRAAGYRLSMADAGLGPPDSDGFIPVGTLLLDQQPREDLFQIWDDYYPEGYYPLEDPEVPG